jgi:hypothetical protein
MARCLALVLAAACSVFALLPAPAEAVCRPQCLDVTKKRAEVRDYDFGDRWQHGKHSGSGKRNHYGWAKHAFHENHGKHRGHGGHDEPPVTQPPVTPPPVTPPPVTPPPVEPPPCLGC